MEAAAQAAADLVSAAEAKAAADAEAKDAAEVDEDLDSKRRDERRRQRRQLQLQQERAASEPEPSSPSSSMLQVAIPAGYGPGDALEVALENGSAFIITVPEGCFEGASIFVEPPADEIDEEEIPSGTERQLITVPDGVQPGDKFHVSTAWGAFFEVECPPGVACGEQMEVELPIEPDPEYPDLPAQSPSASKSAAGDDRMQLGTLPSISRYQSQTSRDGSPTHSGEEEEDADALQTDRSALKKRSQAIVESAGELERASRGAVGEHDGQTARAVASTAVNLALATTKSNAALAGSAASRTDLAYDEDARFLVHQQTVAADEKAKLEGAAGHVADMVVEPSSPPQLSSPVRANEITHCTSPSLGVGSGRRMGERFGSTSSSRAQNAAFRGGRGGHGGRRSEVGSSAVDTMMCRSTALREPIAEAGCRFYVGQAVQVLRSSGAWAVATILEVIHGYETLYRCRLGEGILEKHMGEDELRELQPDEGCAFSQGQTVQIVRPNGLLELATVIDVRMDHSRAHAEPWYSCKLLPSETAPLPAVEQIHEVDLQLPCAQAGCAFFVGQLVQAQRREGSWTLARVVEFALKDYELQYKCVVVRDAVIESWMPASS